MIAVTKCAGVMIGRGALSMPWIFRDTWSYLTTGQVPPPPTIDEKIDLMRQHFRHYTAHRGERAAVAEFRKRISWYAKQLHPCHHLRQDMRLMRDAAHFEELVKQFLDWRHRRDDDVRNGRVPEGLDAADAELTEVG
jgi:tRNA-dihydrouridine synthase